MTFLRPHLSSRGDHDGFRYRIVFRQSLRREVLLKTWTGAKRISALGRFNALQGVTRRSKVLSDVASYSLPVMLECSISIPGGGFQAKHIFSFQTTFWIICPSIMLYTVNWDCMVDGIFWCESSRWLSRGNTPSRETAGTVAAICFESSFRVFSGRFIGEVTWTSNFVDKGTWNSSFVDNGT